MLLGVLKTFTYNIMTNITINILLFIPKETKWNKEEDIIHYTEDKLMFRVLRRLHITMPDMTINISLFIPKENHNIRLMRLLQYQDGDHVDDWRYIQDDLLRCAPLADPVLAVRHATDLHRQCNPLPSLLLLTGEVCMNSVYACVRLCLKTSLWSLAMTSIRPD